MKRVSIDQIFTQTHQLVYPVRVGTACGLSLRLMVKQSGVKWQAHNLLYTFDTHVLRLMFFNHWQSLFFCQSQSLWRNYVYYLQGYFKVINRQSIHQSLVVQSTLS